LKSVSIRFYQELNDFLPNNLKKIKYRKTYKNNPTVKDFIESQGVPHTEIDLILVNNKSVDFKYKLQDKDEISVYPVFESFDISNIIKLRDKPLRNLKFILDVHLGKLTKYLRLVGFECYYRNNLKDPEIVEISNNEDRVILTRDIGILKRSKVTNGYWIRSKDPKQQIHEVLKRFDLYNQLNPFKYCTLCNGVVIQVKKSEIYSKLKPGTAKKFNDFFICKKCKKIYWKGSHYNGLKKFINSLLTEARMKTI